MTATRSPSHPLDRLKAKSRRASPGYPAKPAKPPTPPRGRASGSGIEQANDAAADWIDANQLGRRNLTPDQYSLLRGRRYNRAKKAHGGAREASPQNADLKTSERLAKQHGVSRATIERDGQFAEAVEVVKAVDPEIEAKVTKGEAPPKGAIVEAATVSRERPSQPAPWRNNHNHGCSRPMALTYRDLAR